MLVNSNLTITGERAVLVPYRQEHVPVYHEWMVSRAVLWLSTCLGLHSGFGASLDQEGIFVQEDPALQEATASQPLTIEARLAYRCLHLATILQHLQHALVRLVSPL